MAETTPIEIWFEDEARIGQKNGQVRQWAKRGTRPRQPADQRYDNAYLFGAICPARGVGAALALPYADADMMQLHLDEISRNVADGAHAVLLLDRAGWHTTSKLDVPGNITRSSCPPGRRSSTRSRTSGSICARIGSQTPCSKTTTQSSTPHAPLGENSSLNPKRSHPSECATGLTSVTRYDLWYYANALPSALACFEDDFEACIAHLRLPVTHRRFARTTNLLERLFVEERRRLKIIPNGFGEKPVLKIMFGALIRAADRWRGLRFNEFWLRQIAAVRKELDDEYQVSTTPLQRHPSPEFPANPSLDHFWSFQLPSSSLTL